MKRRIGFIAIFALTIGNLLISSARLKEGSKVKAADSSGASRSQTPRPQRDAQPDKLGTINGARNPELIPDRNAYSMLFRLLAGRHTEVEKNRGKAYVRQIYGCTKCTKLSEKEQAEIESDLNGLLAAVEEFDREVLVLDKQAKALKDRHWPGPGVGVMDELTQLQTQKEKLIDKTIASLSKRITPGGMAKLKQHVDQRVKRNMKLVPSPQISPGGVGWKHRQHQHR